MDNVKIKTILTSYVIKVNNEPATIKASLAEARREVKGMPVNDGVNIVHIVKQTVTEQILDTYEAEVKRVLKASDLDLSDDF